MQYDKSGGGKNFRKYCGISLAWWHSYKWATKYIMKVFSTDFIAPYLHFMFPSRTLNIEAMQHTNHVTYLTYIRLAYPSFKEELAIAMSRPGLTVKQRSMLRNLRDLCEYFIPVVRSVLLFSVLLC